jgi:S-adenosylmethionine-diacylglycerol 3-amino-3-carboxypropyl transferase
MQKIFYEKTWEAPAFLEAFQKYFGRENMAEHGRDAAQFDYVNTEPGRHFAERFKYVCTQLPARHNVYLHRFLSDSYGPSLPPYLQKEKFERLRKLVSRVTPVTNSIEDHLRTSKIIYTKANLSDMFEYMSETNMAHLLKTMYEAFLPGGRIAYWCLLVPRPLPSTLSKNYLSHHDLAKGLWKQDRSWFYRDFHILERI